MPTATVEDYVKAIYLAQHDRPAQARLAGSDRPAPSRGRAAAGRIALGELAARMRVVPGTATAMVKTLADAGLADYAPRRGVRLTPGGEKLALHVLRKHRIVELFLVRVLQLDWSEVHDEAEALEHAISDKVLARLDRLLGFPSADPHGDPIPSSGGRLPRVRSRPLADVPPGTTATLLRVASDDADFLRFAESHGLLPGARVTVTAASPAAATLTVELAGRSLTLSLAAAARIHVSL